MSCGPRTGLCHRPREQPSGVWNVNACASGTPFFSFVGQSVSPAWCVRLSGVWLFPGLTLSCAPRAFPPLRSLRLAPRPPPVCLRPSSHAPCPLRASLSSSFQRLLPCHYTSSRSSLEWKRFRSVRSLSARQARPSGPLDVGGALTHRHPGSPRPSGETVWFIYGRGLGRPWD